jgi:hypothetical protein
VLVVRVLLPADATLKKAKHAVEDAFLSLSTTAATPVDLAYAKEARWVGDVASSESALGLATRLARGATLEGDRAILDAVSAADVRSAAQKFLGPLTRTVVEVYDPAKARLADDPKKPPKPKSETASPDAPKADKPKGDKPKGDKPKAEKPKGEKPKSDKKPGEGHHA